jgi:hypothetical protein
LDLLLAFAEFCCCLRLAGPFFDVPGVEQTTCGWLNALVPDAQVAIIATTSAAVVMTGWYGDRREMCKAGGGLICFFASFFPHGFGRIPFLFCN